MTVFQSPIWKTCEAELTRLYSSTERFYHNPGHVHDCLDQLADVPDSECEDREAIMLALWFHDAIYDAKRGDNEAASAELASEWLGRMRCHQTESKS